MGKDRIQKRHAVNMAASVASEIRRSRSDNDNCRARFRLGVAGKFRSRPMIIVRSRNINLFVGLAAMGAVMAPHVVSAQVSAESILLAKSLPVADMHYHATNKISPNELRQWMQRNNIIYVGGVGAKGSGGRNALIEHRDGLKNRYVPMGFQGFISRFVRRGLGPLTSNSNPRIQAVFNRMNRALRSGKFKGIGEVITNGQRHPAFRVKHATNHPAFVRLFDVIAKAGSVMNVHLEADSDSLNELESLLARNRNGRIVLGHCGTDATAAQINELMDRHSNVFCDLSNRHPPRTSQERTIFTEIFNRGGINSNWKRLLEKHADRFMVGTDYEDIEIMEEIIAVIRQGLLPYLTPMAARKIAFENALKLFDLPVPNK